MSKGLFGDMFDFNKDGEMGFIVRAAELAFLNELLTEEEKEEIKKRGIIIRKNAKNLKKLSFSHPFWQKGWGFFV